MKNVKTKGAPQNLASRRELKAALSGPSFYEVEFLRQLKEEMEVFLRSKSFSTIQQFDIAFAGQDYVGHVKIHA